MKRTDSILQQFYMSRLPKAELGGLGDNTRVVSRPRPLTKTEYEENQRISQAQKKGTEKKKQEVLVERKQARETKGTFQEKNFNIGEKLRLFPGNVGGMGEIFDDYINPFKIVGDLASNLGNSRTAREAALNVAMTAGLGALGFDPLGSGLKSSAFKEARTSFPKFIDDVSYAINKPKTVDKITNKNLYKELGAPLDIKEGINNQGVYSLRRFPDHVVKFEPVESISRGLGYPEYKTFDFINAMKNIKDKPNIAKVKNQINLEDNKRALIMNRVADGFRPLDLTPINYRKLPDDAIRKMYYDLKEIINNDLGFDFFGNNYTYNPIKKEFSLFDFSPQFKPGSDGNSRFWINDVLGNTNKNIVGNTEANKNLKTAIISKLVNDHRIAGQNLYNEIGTGFTLRSQNDISKLLNKGEDVLHRKLYNALKDVDIYQKGGIIKDDRARGDIQSYPQIARMKDTPQRKALAEAVAKREQQQRARKINQYHQEQHNLREIDPFESEDTRSWWSDSRAKERGDEAWNNAKKVTAVGQFIPHPVVRYPSIALNSAMAGLDSYLAFKEGDITNANINAIGAIPFPGYGSIKTLRNTPGLNARQKASVARTALGALGIDLFGTSADLTNNFGLEQKKKGGIIKDDRGQWAHPGEVTRISSPNITMQGVPYPVLGVGSNGQEQMMYPGQEYKFPGASYVDEYPIMQRGGQMIKRKDGSYSQRGLWDNIRANRGSGKKPTKEMLEQERKIPKAQLGFISDAIDKVEQSIPSSVKSFSKYLAAVAGAPVSKITNKSQFSKEQLASIYNAAMNAKKRTGNLSGSTIYSDYGKEYANPWGKSILDKLSIPYKIATDPNYDNAFTLGRYSYNFNEDGSVDISDEYNFNHDAKGKWYTKPVTWMDNILAGNKNTKTKFKINPLDIKKYGGMKSYKAGGSIVDFLKENKADSSKTARIELAKLYNINNYTGTAEQNIYLLNKLKNSSKKTPLLNKSKDNKTDKKDITTNSEKIKKPLNGYVDLAKEYNLNPFSKLGIEQAKKIQSQYPGTKFICDADGCAEIASNAARAYDVDFGRANAWDFGNRSNVIYQNPDYAGKITGKQGVLENPKSYDVPIEILNSKNTLIGLNRNNNLITDEGSKISRLIQPLALMTGRGKAKDKKNANDSYDYANPDLYPNSRGYEHIGFSLGNKQLLHGTGKGKDHPAFYIIDDMTDGIDLSGYGKYQPVEAMQPDNFIASTFKKAKRFLGMKYGGTNNPGFEALPEYVQAKILANMGYGGYYNPIMEEGEEIYEMQDGGTFGKAFAAARKEGKKVFTWNGKSYTTQLAEETNQEKPRSMTQNSSSNPPARKAAPVKPVVKRASSLPQDREVINDPRNIFQKLFNMNEDEIRRFNLPVDVYDAYQKQREDNKGKNFGIVSKKNARAYFFDDEGNLVVQDEVGFGKDRGEDQPVYYKVMTTPSGTYRMERPKFAAPVADKILSGYDAKNFFYMDNVDPSKRLIDAPGSTRTSTPRQAMHGIPNHLKAQRSKAFNNKRVDDNYMSAGCINCKRPFLDNPYFDSFQEGLVYVLPEKKDGGFTVTRSNDRKGKTHKVTGPDGTVKYFGDSKLGQHPKDPERKKAFYARHKKNLDNNPYFRAFARATWQDGGQPGLSFWNTSKTPQGAITPTGMSNYFNDNKQGFDQASFIKKMQDLNLDTSSNLSLQQDMMRKYPDLVNQVMSEYGNTNAGRFDDGIIGARVINAASKIPSPTKQVPPQIQQSTTTYKNPNAGYVVNVRGDDKDGAYYFPSSENFDKLSSVIPGSKEYRNDYKGATVNMTNANFMKQYGNNYKEALGQAYKRDPQNPNQFIPIQKNGGSTWSGSAWYQTGGTYVPEYVEMAYGGIHLDPAKKGTFKAQATRMGMGVQEAAAAILNAPEGKYSPAMRKKANFARNFAKQDGGLVDGAEMEVTPEQAEWLKSQGYEFEII